MTGPLTNRRIALAETRELDLLAGMLEREGAEIIRSPLIAIHDAPDVGLVEAWLRRLIAGHHADIVLYTGEGVRRLVGFAERAGVRGELIEALSKVRKFVRGPKPVRALREIGLSGDVTVEPPTTEGIIAAFASVDLRGRRIGVQIYGQRPNQALLEFFRARGAECDVVAPYVYASEADDQRVESLIGEMAGGRVAAVAFTSSSQVERLFEVAAKANRGEDLKTGFARTKIAAVGPVVESELNRHGLRSDAMPSKSFTLKPLVRSILQMFDQQEQR